MEAERPAPDVPEAHHMPLSGGDRKALTKELSKSRAMTKIFAERAAEKRHDGEALIREADTRQEVHRKNSDKRFVEIQVCEAIELIVGLISPLKEG